MVHVAKQTIFLLAGDTIKKQQKGSVSHKKKKL